MERTRFAPETSFEEHLYAWMGRAPWLAISALAHLLVFFVLAAIPWKRLAPERHRAFVCPPIEVPEDPFDDPKEEPRAPEAPAPDEDPLACDWSVPESARDEPRFEDSADPFAEADSLDYVLGLGPGSAGKLAGRLDRSRDLGATGGSGTEEALRDALAWLVHHQSADGSWDGDGFAAHCGSLGPHPCDGAGHGAHDVGLTGLALLALLGDGNTTGRGPYRDAVTRGIHWLKGEQDAESGRIGPDTSREFLYDHAIATLALCEAFHFGKSPLLRPAAQRAVDFIQRAQNPYGAWRYDVPPSGENDTSITGWMIFALVSAREAGLHVDEAALDWALAWLDEVTDATGRVGYLERGSASSRSPANRHFPTEAGEALTAVGLLCRIFLGQDADTTLLGGEPVLRRHAEVLERCLPEWNEAGFGCDMYYWYYGTYAMYQLGGESWRKWNAAMKDAVLAHQRRDGDARGSWDPVGPWGSVGGRVYSTALMTLCIEVYFRYAKVLGGR